MKLKANFSNNLKNIRAEKNISQQELAEKMQTSRVSIAYWETGKVDITLQRLIKLAEALDISLYDLIEYNGTTFTNSKEENSEVFDFTTFLIKHQILNKNQKLSKKELDKVIEFLKINISFILKK